MSGNEDNKTGKVNPRTKEGNLLQHIVDFYLSSRDFNGLPVSDAHGTDIDLNAASRLIRKGFIEVIGDKDYLNPHIRPWPSKQSAEDQISDMKRAMKPGEPAVCLYPTSVALQSAVAPGDYEGRPYELKLALGGTTLQPVYFRADVVEPYREDPRFKFQMGDSGFNFNITDELYMDEDEPESEKVSLLHGGLAYNFSTKDKKGLNRGVCVFLADLADFTPEMQQRWSTFELPDQDEYSMHPVWWKSQMGHFPDAPGPFTRLFGELEALNSLHKTMTGEDLFRTTDRPEEFSWLLRPSRREFEQFVHDLDKLISDNLMHKALDAMGIADKDEDGNKIGTLNRLELVLERAGIPEESRKKALAPFREVRALRQKPAHKLSGNQHDITLIEEQVRLLNDVVNALSGMRSFWQTHPSMSDVEVSDYLDQDKYYRL